MTIQKPILKKIQPGLGSSVFVQKSTIERAEQKPFWHYHPEIEMVYVDKGKGKRHIGNHMSYYTDSQLILIGSMLPHIGYTDRPNHGSELLVQFLPDFLGAGWKEVIEYNPIQALFERAKNGLLFSKSVENKWGASIHELNHLQGFDRLHLLIRILHGLSVTDEYELLNAQHFSFEANLQESSRLERVYSYVHQNFQQPISVDEIADLASMTTPAFCRYFKKRTGKTFTQMVNEYRVVHATKLLAETDHPIEQICYDCGFNNFSHFNNVFSRLTGSTAGKYRRELKTL
ncbi:helix-turn-helix domain-containing protein [Nonlabens xiamenensis]|uniref:helix-turn-helix domain-containing protein n=1 Tax=Nonlabens xiamenensis TaxID=2341043 RepID=UPI000F60794C|nr:AraC family transcriptional regulator [Nonlabens xiamenensis]